MTLSIPTALSHLCIYQSTSDVVREKLIILRSSCLEVEPQSVDDLLGCFLSLIKHPRHKHSLILSKQKATQNYYKVYLHDFKHLVAFLSILCPGAI